MPSTHGCAEVIIVAKAAIARSPRRGTSMSSICMTPITGPKAWRGDRLAADRSWIVTFTEPEIAELEAALAAAKTTGRPMAEIGREHFPLPGLAPRLARILDEIRSGRGFVLLRGLPVRRYSDDDVGLLLWGL